MLNIPTQPETRLVPFTQEEANQLIELVNVANKKKGLKVAHYAVYFFDKLSTPFKSGVQNQDPTPRDLSPDNESQHAQAEVYEMKKTVE